MFRNQYDTDVTTWSPAGRLFQVEYAMEAVKQGSAAVGLRSKTHAVLAAVNKAASELASHQRKVFRADDHVGVAIAGLTADGRVLSRSDSTSSHLISSPPIRLDLANPLLPCWERENWCASIYTIQTFRLCSVISTHGD